MAGPRTTSKSVSIPNTVTTHCTSTPTPVAATALSPVLRLPGFANRKYDAECLVRATNQSGKTYNLRDFKVASGPAKGDRTAEQKPPRLGSVRETLTQSERDWAYAKRALARGDDP